MSDIFNDLQPTHIKPDGSPHFRGQIYRPRQHKIKLYKINPVCQLCRGVIQRIEDATLDHIIPRAHGGHTTFDNIQLAHRKCNLDKGHDL